MHHASGTTSPPAAGPPRAVAILGMHRSGTSLLAGTLEECGLDLGDVNTFSPANRKGNRESWLLTALHEDLLRAAGGGWRAPPERPVSWGPLHRKIRDLYIGQFAASPVWGFKDPRLLFCLEGWLEVLPGLELVGVFRHPLEVAWSLVRRTPARFTPEKCLCSGWPTTAGCSPGRNGSPVRCSNTATTPEPSTPEPARLPAGSACRAADPAALTFFDANLRHERADDSSLPDDVAATYARLRHLAATWE